MCRVSIDNSFKVAKEINSYPRGSLSTSCCYCLLQDLRYQHSFIVDSIKTNEDGYDKKKKKKKKKKKEKEEGKRRKEDIRDSLIVRF